MKKIAFLSCESLEGFIVDDHLLVQELSELFEISTIPWKSIQDWSKFDAVIIRTTWDYMADSENFLKALKMIQLSGTKMFNSYSVVAWNIHKFYLKELKEAGTFIVPTLFFNYQETITLPQDWQASRFVVKPAISAGAYKTTVLSRHEIESGTFRANLSPGDWLLQPFIESIDQGEISLIYFDKKFSHGLIKIPKAGEFRVQEEFGGNIVAYTPDEEMLKLAEDILSRVDLPLLYARIDFIALDNSYALMELELIEPALYFSTHINAAKNFRAALENYL